MPWQITVCGETFREDQLTLQQACAIEDATGLNWRVIHPMNSAKVAVTLGSVLLAERTGITQDEAREKLGALGVNEWTDAFEVVEDDLPTAWEGDSPLSAGEDSTG